MKNTFVYLVVALCLSGCTFKKSSDALNRVIINLEGDDFHQEAAFRSFRFVSLESVPESMLSDVAKVVTGNDRIYVLPMADARVFIFSSEGKYMNSLQRGEGPGEVHFVSDMECRDNRLYVLDNYRTIREYDLDGNYVCDVFRSEDPFSLSVM